jgi:glutamate racemase
MQLIKLLSLVALAAILSSRITFPQDEASTINQTLDMEKILNKKKITIVITDSGLGGLSVCAGIEDKLRQTGSYEEVNLIYFNALPEKGKGYNSMPTAEVKADVFNQALISMEKKYSPDIILIACNTLSVVYPLTQFARVSQTPVLGIVDFGVSMILAELKKNAAGEVLILGTPTTIKSGSHKRKLIESGVDEKNIIAEPCPNLESEIQNDPKSQAVEELINVCLSEALRKSDKVNAPIITTLCCTHYGFSIEVFQSSLKKITERESIILNPNELMINSIVLDAYKNRFSNSDINVQVVSRAIINDNEKETIGSLIKSFAPLSASALNNYEYDPGLFEFHY